MTRRGCDATIDVVLTLALLLISAEPVTQAVERSARRVESTCWDAAGLEGSPRTMDVFFTHRHARGVKVGLASALAQLCNADEVTTATGMGQHIPEVWNEMKALRERVARQRSLTERALQEDSAEVVQAIVQQLIVTKHIPIPDASALSLLHPARRAFIDAVLGIPTRSLENYRLAHSRLSNDAEMASCFFCRCAAHQPRFR